LNRLKLILLALILILAFLPGSNTPGDNTFQRADGLPGEEYYEVPEISAEITILPWANDKDFLEANKNNQTPILMAGFCAVLKNPLPCEEYNIRLASKSVKGVLVKPSAIFSQNSSIGPYTSDRGYREGASYIGGKITMAEGGGVCKIATVLYNLVVLSDLEVIERHNHSMPTNYVPYGQDATVAYGIKDFRFKNTTEGNILIWSQFIDCRLYIAFYGTEDPPKVTWSHEITNLVKPPKKYITNPELAPGEMKTIVNGLEGARVKTTVIIEHADGSKENKNMGISFYNPLPELIEVN